MSKTFEESGNFAGEFGVGFGASPPLRRAGGAERSGGVAGAPIIPEYLKQHYWWAYVHPNALRVFERQWLVNAILWGNYRRLRDAALDQLGASLQGLTLQIGCAYGDISAVLAQRAQASGGAIDIVDVLPQQLDNLSVKLPRDAPVRRLLMDSAALDVGDASVDRALLFLLLHEQPEAWRRATLAEAFRVVKPGGRIVIVDYACPRIWNPLRYLFQPVLARLEPFALELWRDDLEKWMPKDRDRAGVSRRRFFGGLYQLLTIQR